MVSITERPTAGRNSSQRFIVVVCYAFSQEFDEFAGGFSNISYVAIWNIDPKMQQSYKIMSILMICAMFIGLLEPQNGPWIWMCQHFSVQNALK